MPPFPSRRATEFGKSCAGMLERYYGKREREWKDEGEKKNTLFSHQRLVYKQMFLTFFFVVCVNFRAFTPVTASQMEKRDKSREDSKQAGRQEGPLKHNTRSATVFICSPLLPACSQRLCSEAVDVMPSRHNRLAQLLIWIQLEVQIQVPAFSSLFFQKDMGDRWRTLRRLFERINGAVIVG